MPDAGRYAPSPDIRRHEAAGRLVVHLPASGAIHVLNRTARLILAYLETEPADFEELLAMLVEATGEDRQVVRRDLMETLDDFVAAGILELRA